LIFDIKAKLNLQVSGPGIAVVTLAPCRLQTNMQSDSDFDPCLLDCTPLESLQNDWLSANPDSYTMAAFRQSRFLHAIAVGIDKILKVKYVEAGKIVLIYL
jgi:hypothetical protein